MLLLLVHRVRHGTLARLRSIVLLYSCLGDLLDSGVYEPAWRMRNKATTVCRTRNDATPFGRRVSIGV